MKSPQVYVEVTFGPEVPVADIRSIKAALHKRAEELCEGIKNRAILSVIVQAEASSSKGWNKERQNAVKPIQIVEQCVGFSAAKLALLAGLLTPVVGFDRAIIAIDLINSASKTPCDDYQFFSNLVQLLGLECSDRDWHRAMESLRKLKVTV